MNNLVTMTPLMRQTVGFDRFYDLFESLLGDTGENFENYPPYNIEKTGKDEYKIVMAVAGFTMDDINIIINKGVLSVSGKAPEKTDENNKKDDSLFLHKGIAARSFEKIFRLADYIRVIEAEMSDGLLTIHLIREIPEEKKPQLIPIKSSNRVSLSGRKKVK